MDNQNFYDEEKVTEELTKQRYSLIRKMEIRDAVERYKADAKEDAKYLVLKSNVREDKKAKELYSYANAFNNWKDAETYASTVTNCIIVDSATKEEIAKEAL